MNKREMERLVRRLERVGSTGPLDEAEPELAAERERELVEVEELFGHRFPRDYRWLQIHAPGTSLRTFVFHNVAGNFLHEVGCNLPLKPWTHKDIWLADLDGGTPGDPEWDKFRSWFRDLVPIGHDDGNGHNYLCYDFGFDRRRPPILRFDGETSWEVLQHRHTRNPLEYVAPSLTSYLGLTEYDWETDPYCEAAPPKAAAKALAWTKFRDALRPGRGARAQSYAERMPQVDMPAGRIVRQPSTQDGRDPGVSTAPSFRLARRSHCGTTLKAGSCRRYQL